jgi:predicted transposase YbfD/YdcC
LVSHFESLTDPRALKARKHLLTDVMAIAVCAILCGADGPTAIHRWAVSRFDWLNQFLSLPNGTPSRDCIRRVLMAINPGDFQRCFEAWIRSTVIPLLDGTVQQVAIDGKTLRRAHNSRQDLDPLHVVSAWATELGLSLGQVATGDKPDEISGIQAVLKVLDLPHSLITLDALGCQKEIVNAIVEGGGRYVIAIKANQPKLFSAVSELCEERLDQDLEEVRYSIHDTVDRAHGRIDERSYFVTKVPHTFALRKEWPSIRAVGYAVRYTTHADGTESEQVRYYILSDEMSASRFAEAIRGHWQIEAMHWVLDVTFREDQTRSADRSLANNLSWLRRFAITMLRRHPLKDSLRGKMQYCMFNTSFLSEVLAHQ